MTAPDPISQRLEAVDREAYPDFPGVASQSPDEFPDHVRAYRRALEAEMRRVGQMALVLAVMVREADMWKQENAELREALDMLIETVVPKRERSIWRDKTTRASVLRGLKEAREGNATPLVWKEG
jgi:regulator of replication initiation timing